MLLRVSAVLCVLLIWPLLSSAQTSDTKTQPPCKDFTAQTPVCKDPQTHQDYPGQERPICITQKIDSQGSKTPHAVPQVQQMCAQDWVRWELDPLLGSSVSDFLILFQKKAPFEKQFFTKAEAGNDHKATSPKLDYTYPYKVWFPDGTIEDPGIIIH